MSIYQAMILGCSMYAFVPMIVPIGSYWVQIDVVPTELDVSKFEEALSRVLQLYPHAAGQLRCIDRRWSVRLSTGTS